jgi:general secretion pathway protein G
MTMHQLLRQRTSGRRNAFTLLEVLVVVAIIVILASVGTIYFFRYLDDAKKETARAKAHNIQTAAKSYYIKYGEVPPNAQALINPGQGEKPFLEGGNTAIQTPWGGLYTITVQQRGDSAEYAFVISWTDGENQPHQYPDR